VGLFQVAIEVFSFRGRHNISYEELLALKETVKMIKALFEHYSPCFHHDILKDPELQNEK